MTSPATDRQLIDEYLEGLRTQRKLSGHTLDGYRRDLAELLGFSTALPHDARLAATTHFQIRKFAAQLHAKGLNPRSIARKLSAWRGFFDWLAEQVELAANPVDGVKAPKRGKPLPKALSADDAVRMVSSDNPRKERGSPSQLCNRAMFELLYSSGLRVSELAGLDVEFQRGSDGRSSLGWIDRGRGSS